MQESRFTEKQMVAIKELVERKLIVSDLDEVSSSYDARKVALYITSIKEVKDKNGNYMAFLKASDTKEKEVNIVVFSSYWKYLKVKLKENKPFLINTYEKKGSFLLGFKRWVSHRQEIERAVFCL